MKVNSLICFPLIYENELWGFIVLSKIDGYKHWTDEVNLLQDISNQIYIAINQAELYEKVQKQVERDNLLLKLAAFIRSSLDLDEVLTIICREMAKNFNVQRASIYKFIDFKWEIKKEYKTQEDLKGLSDLKTCSLKKIMKHLLMNLPNGIKNQGLLLKIISKKQTDQIFLKEYTVRWE